MQRKTNLALGQLVLGTTRHLVLGAPETVARSHVEACQDFVHGGKVAQLAAAVLPQEPGGREKIVRRNDKTKLKKTIKRKEEKKTKKQEEEARGSHLPHRSTW